VEARYWQQGTAMRAGLPSDEEHAGAKNVRCREEKCRHAFNADFDRQEI
jgi:hypothetical protein